MALLGATTARAGAPPATAELRTRVERYVAPLAADGLVSGCLVVARAGEAPWERCFGAADAELAVPNAPETRFNVGRIGEVFTRVALARLEDEKKVARADGLSRWLPRFPSAARVNVGHLAEHRSGIPPRVTTGDQEALPRAPHDIVELAAAHPLRFEPGAQREESPAGYGVLARVLELAARQSWSDVLRTRVIEPAGLASAAHATARDVVPGRAAGYLPWPGGQVRPAPPKDLSTFVGSGSVLATAGDLVRLARALREGRLGPSATAWAQGEPRLRWTGTGHGYAAFLEEDPATGTIVAFAGNLATPAVERLRSAVPRLAAGERVATPRREPPARPGSFDVLLPLEGRYAAGGATVSVVAHRDGVLVAGDRVLVPAGDRTLRSLSDDAIVTVVAGPSGAAEALEWRTGDEVVRATRVR